MNKSRRSVVYIAHALRGDWNANVARAREFVDVALREGYAPIAPYLMGATLDDAVDAERAIGLDWDAAVIERCDALWACGEVLSAGVRAEMDLADRCGVPVLRLPSIEAANRMLGRQVPIPW